MAKTPFMALTGAELKTIVLQRIDGLVGQLAQFDYKQKAVVYSRIVKEFDGDQRFEYHLAYPKVSWEATIDVTAAGQWTCKVHFEVYPGEPPEFDVLVGSQVVPVVKAAAVVAEERYMPKGEEQKAPAIEIASVPASDDMRSNKIEPVTSHGDVIQTGPEAMPEGWAPPEDRAAIALEVDRVARHNARLARQLAEENEQVVTSVTDGESIDRPNSARREAGLPVPKPQQIDGGQVVDLPMTENGIF